MRIVIIILINLFTVFTYGQKSQFKRMHKLSTWGTEFNSVDRFKVALNQNETILAAGAMDGSLIIWNVKEGTVIKNLGEQAISTYDLAFSPDGRFLINVGTSYPHKAIQIWNARTFELIKLIEHDTLTEYDKHEDGSIFSETMLALCFANEKLITSSTDGKLTAWDMATWQPIFEQVAGINMWDIEYSKTKETLVSCDNYTCLKFWKIGLKEFELQSTIETDETSIEEISLSPISDYISFNSSGAVSICLFGIQDSIITIPFEDPETLVNSVIWSPDGKTLYTSHSANNVKIWDFKTLQLKEEIFGDLNLPNQNEAGYNRAFVSISESGKYMILSNDSGFIYLYKKR